MLQNIILVLNKKIIIFKIKWVLVLASSLCVHLKMKLKLNTKRLKTTSFQSQKVLILYFIGLLGFNLLIDKAQILKKVILYFLIKG